MIRLNDKHYNDVSVKVLRAIASKSLIEFDYSDKSKKLEGARTIEPYLLGINGQGNLFISGYFRATEEQMKNNMKSKQGNYLIDNIKPNSLKVLTGKFTGLQIHPDKIYKTTNTIIIAVAYFPEIILATYFS